MLAQLSSSSAPPVRLNSAVAARLLFLMAGMYVALNRPVVQAAAHSVQVSIVRPRPSIGSHSWPVSSFRLCAGTCTSYERPDEPRRFERDCAASRAPPFARRLASAAFSFISPQILAPP